MADALYAPALSDIDGGPNEAQHLATIAQVAVGWDLVVVVNRVSVERALDDARVEVQVWSFDGDGNPLACLARVPDAGRSTIADLLALTVPLAERFHPSHVTPPTPASRYGG